MSGVSFRNSHVDLKELAELEDDIDFALYKPFIEEYEYRCIKQYNRQNRES